MDDEVLCCIEENEEIWIGNRGVGPEFFNINGKIKGVFWDYTSSQKTRAWYFNTQITTSYPWYAPTHIWYLFYQGRIQEFFEGGF